jgi:hypothetical protein
VDSIQNLEQLRELFLSAPGSAATRIVAVIGSLTVAGVVLYLVRKRRLREEYTPIWMAVAAGLVLISLRSDVLMAITRAIGAWTPSSTIFFLGEAFLMVICLNFAVRLSRAGLEIRTLGQELSILRARLDELAAGDGPASLGAPKGG